MTESEKRLEILQKKLLSDNNRIISSAIISLRNEDPFSGAIVLLTELFDRTNDAYIKELIRNFMNDLKEKAARAEIIAELSKKYKPDTISMIASSCWQSGLDYSGYSMDISRVFIESEYLAALECFTVLEESVSNIKPDLKKQIIEYLDKYRGKSTDEKNKLIEALVSILI
jgi:hypothetical protein